MFFVFIQYYYVSLLTFQTEQSYKNNTKMLSEFQVCEQNGIPLAVIIGQSEIESGVVKLKTIGSREEVIINPKVFCFPFFPSALSDMGVLGLNRSLFLAPGSKIVIV